jgi:hypothetical protein
MNEYIEKAELIKKLCFETAEWSYSPTIKTIKEFPSADVQPVVHAYWIELPKALNPNENPCKCSNCGHILSFMNGYPKSKYCDECGAKMDVVYEDDKIRAIKVTG